MQRFAVPPFFAEFELASIALTASSGPAKTELVTAINPRPL
jgi:hypothetical protein